MKTSDKTKSKRCLDCDAPIASAYKRCANCMRVWRDQTMDKKETKAAQSTFVWIHTTSRSRLKELAVCSGESMVDVLDRLIAQAYELMQKNAEGQEL